MGNLMGSIFSATIDKSADETVAFNAMSAAAASAMAYLGATLEATTPEVRRLFGEYTTQAAIGHEALMALSVKKGWITPYDQPTKQLQMAMQKSKEIINSER